MGHHILCLFFLFFLCLQSFFPHWAPAEQLQQEPLTTNNPYLATDELELALIALTKSELLVEAKSWQELLRAKAVEIAKAEIVIKRQNRAIEKARDIQTSTQNASEKIVKLQGEVERVRHSGDGTEIRNVEKTTVQAQELVDEINTLIDEAAKVAEQITYIRKHLDDKTAQGLIDSTKAARQADQALEQVKEVVTGIDLDSSTAVVEAAEKAKDSAAEARQATETVQEKVDTAIERFDASSREEPSVLIRARAAMEDLEGKTQNAKVVLLETVNRLREERTKISDNFNAVLLELAAKTDGEDSKTLALIKEYQLYSRGIQGIHLDIGDTTSSWISIKGWVVSEEGGLRFIFNLLHFCGILLGAWLLSKVVSILLNRALILSSNISQLLRDFLKGIVRWIIMSIGLIMALAAMEVSIAPLLALLGAAGFIIGLALQDSLSNFASGIMILFFRPFDVDDVIDAGGVSGTVTSVSLVSSTIMTFDNKKMLVPNNKIWRDVITNATDVKTRRIDLEFAVNYDSDIMQVQTILQDIAAEHPKVLETPEPMVHLHNITDTSIIFICRPWIRSVDYWSVRWDLMQSVKLRFAEAGVEAPHLQQDIHLRADTHSATPDTKKKTDESGEV